jgi:hypothetical protein
METNIMLHKNNSFSGNKKCHTITANVNEGKLNFVSRQTNHANSKCELLNIMIETGMLLLCMQHKLRLWLVTWDKLYSHNS